ncbi:site-specific integrase [Roseivivax sp. THAF30]|uniref:tyrosine-type recombinase/integrase n=1 Tax=Roseivivax sp. THAF30 TaxID=2587852 RepID=UPI0012683F8A|nr:site-specific integrase [Roseivivax sp. THAF30]QFT62709.1 Tyrosine recombinase XerD [Roseivivax sp. THAF30]
MSYETLAAAFMKTEHLRNPCRFAEESQVSALPFRETPYWHSMYRCRHIGIHRPDLRMCNWTARILTKDKKYRQKCLGPAIDIGRGSITYQTAVCRALEWFDSGEVKSTANEAATLGKTSEVCFCPIGQVYTVGHALKDYSEWTRLSRSPGGHYNNLVLINYHLIPYLAHLPLEDFSAKNLKDLAQRVLDTPPRYGFMERQLKSNEGPLTADQLRKRKRTFNSLVTILKMAFRHAWDNAEIQSERPWRCLKRIPVNHSPRTIFLDREECNRLLASSTPALKRLVLAALYTGCRVGELGSLRVEDVAREGFGIRVAAFKRSPARFVFLPDEGMAFFLAQCEGKSGQDHVFVSDMGKPWVKQHIRLFRRAVSTAGLPSAFVFHVLRHTYASDLVRQGVSIDIVAKQLGHANSLTVSNTYGHFAEQFREEQIRRRFSPLSREQRDEMERRACQLAKLWTSLQTEDWRAYARTIPDTSKPKKSFARPAAEVAEVFDRAEGTRIN